MVEITDLSVLEAEMNLPERFASVVRLGLHVEQEAEGDHLEIKVLEDLQ